MRLLKLKTNGKFSLTEDIVGDVPPYAILSHTWGADTEEVTFKDLEDNTGESKAGYSKIQFCGKQAHNDGLEYFWVDTFASINQTTPSCQRLSPPCFAGIVTPLNATCTCQMFRSAIMIMMTSPSGRGNQLFENVDGSHEAGHFKNSLLRNLWNSFHQIKSLLVTRRC